MFRSYNHLRSHVIQNVSKPGVTRTEWTSCDTDDNDVWGYKACFAGCFDPIAQNDDGENETCPANQVMPNEKVNARNVSEYVKKATEDADFSLSSIDEDSSVKILTGWFSHEGLHLAPGVQNALSNMLLVKAGLSERIYCKNYPLPASLVDRFRMAGVSAEGGSLAILMLLGFTFLTSSFCLFVVEERETKCKHLQQISGINGVVYWVGTLIWDHVNYLICILVITILFAAFDLDGFGPTSIGAVFVLLFMYGFASIPFVYMLSFLFSSAVSAFSLIVTLTFITGLAGYIANLVLTALQDDSQETVESVLLFLPNFK
eukprot:sb/3466938/